MSRTSGSRWRRLRLVILERDGYQCQIRGPRCEGKATDVDHIIPIADGGPEFEETNLRAACHPCNIMRAQVQKRMHGWKRASTRIILVVGPVASGKSSYVRDHAGVDDLVVDYDAISRALGQELPYGHGGARHDLVMQLRNRLLNQIRRGDVPTPRAWIISSNPLAEQMFPFHEVRVIDPGRDEVVQRCKAERPEELWPLVDKWYSVREGLTDWEW